MPRERQRVRQFALALDGGAVDELSLAPLARLAESLHGRGAAAPTDAFKLALRNRILAVGAVSTTPAGGLPQPAPWRRRLVAASAVLALSAGGAAATAAASADALPGDRLYEVKRAIENAQLFLATSDQAKAERYLAIASTRLEEINALLAEHSSVASDPVLVQDLRETMSAMADAVAAGSALFFEIFERTGNAAVLAPLEAFLAERVAGLTDVRELLPAELLGSQDSLLVDLEDLALRVASVTGRSAESLARTGTTGSLLSRDDRPGASRSSERMLLASIAPEAIAQSLEAVRAAAEAAAAAAAAAEHGAEGAAAATAPPKHRAGPDSVEREVRRFVEVNVVGRDGVVDEISVEAMPRTGHAKTISTGSLRATPATPAGSASARLLGVLPLPTSDGDKIILGSLTASFDPSGSKYASLRAEN